MEARAAKRAKERNKKKEKKKRKASEGPDGGGKEMRAEDGEGAQAGDCDD